MLLPVNHILSQLTFFIELSSLYFFIPLIKHYLILQAVAISSFGCLHLVGSIIEIFKSFQRFSMYVFLMNREILPIQEGNFFILTNYTLSIY